MSGDIRSAFITLALSLPAIVLCLSVHETAHGGAAYLLGDRTARDSGRVTLSPMAHIDPIGFLCLLLFGFGWARPVPVNIANFRNRRWGMALTALAGPVSNFITAFIAYCLYFVVRMNMTNTFLWSLSQFLLIVASMSVGLGVFNLVPVHPLDGSLTLFCRFRGHSSCRSTRISSFSCLSWRSGSVGWTALWIGSATAFSCWR